MQSCSMFIVLFKGAFVCASVITRPPNTMSAGLRKPEWLNRQKSNTQFGDRHKVKLIKQISKFLCFFVCLFFSLVYTLKFYYFFCSVGTLTIVFSRGGRELLLATGDVSQHCKWTAAMCGWTLKPEEIFTFCIWSIWKVEPSDMILLFYSIHVFGKPTGILQDQ